MWETNFGRLNILATSPKESTTSKVVVRLPTRWKEGCCACAVALKQGSHAPGITLNVLRVARPIDKILGRLAPAHAAFLLPRLACCSAGERLPRAACVVLVRLETNFGHLNTLAALPKESAASKAVVRLPTRWKESCCAAYRANIGSPHACPCGLLTASQCQLQCWDKAASHDIFHPHAVGHFKL
ncbi:hypothetical protein HAX54_053013 [Datura stramonium]|uniref:Uncharacterized protein n=1 Tax=Datura stramonium TaxID=4076 RepID=A0ABS8SZR4_DATST|nr:hypothetical protein [Datura stramonium]